MAQQSKSDRSEKRALHPRNRHRASYNFAQLEKACPELHAFERRNPAGEATIDFSDPMAVKALNKALLKVYYRIDNWDLPPGYLCPPIPGRADYIHYMADLLASSGNNSIPTGDQIKVLDIGVGANCVYPLIGNAEYGWRFVGSDVDAQAIASAKRIVAANKLENKIELRLQANKDNIFSGIIKPDEHFDLSICNPPFHASRQEAQVGTARKQMNLGNRNAAPLNFGGQSNELWCKGGEQAFITTMIRESRLYAKNCRWFTSLVAKSAHLPAIRYALQEAQPTTTQVIEMAQGSKISRVIAWTFL